MLKLNATQTTQAIGAAVKMNIPLFIWGSPGIGKSDTLKAFAKAQDATLVDIRLSQYDSVDLRGLPSASNNLTIWNPPATLPFEGNAAFNPDPNHLQLLFLDELLQAMPAVQSVAFQLVLDRRCGEHKLMDNVRVFAASNRMGDRAGAQRMASPLANRFTHIELIPNLDDWCSWAWGANLAPLPIAFLRMRPELLNTFDPSKGEVAFATPRSWETACEIVGADLPTDIRYALLAGAIGEGPAAELEAFMRVWEQMPNIDGIILDPDKATVPTDPATLFAVMAALAQRAAKGNFANIVKYTSRVPQEFAMRCIKDCVHRTPEVQTTKAFSQFAVANADVWQG